MEYRYERKVAADEERGRQQEFSSHVLANRNGLSFQMRFHDRLLQMMTYRPLPARKRGNHTRCVKLRLWYTAAGLVGDRIALI